MMIFFSCKFDCNERSYMMAVVVISLPSLCFVYVVRDGWGGW